MSAIKKAVAYAVVALAFYAINQILCVGVCGDSQGQANALLLCLIISYQIVDFPLKKKAEEEEG